MGNKHWGTRGNRGPFVDQMPAQETRKKREKKKGTNPLENKWRGDYVVWRDDSCEMTMSAAAVRQKEDDSQPTANKPAEADTRTARGHSTNQEK